MIYFLLFYLVIYMGNAVYGTYLPVYFQSVGATPSEIGTLLSLGPLIALFAQPFWGSRGDYASNKNTVLMILVIGCGSIMLLFPLSTLYAYLLLMVCLFTFFHTSVFAISDAITLQELEKQKRWSFGLIRMGGTVGFALMSIVFGYIAHMNINYMFPVYSLIMLAALLLLLRFPKVPGYRATGDKVRMWALFKQRKLMIYMGISMILQITLGYYYTFFPVYYKTMGGDSVLLGWSMVISSISEIPFLLFAKRIFERVRITHVLLVASIAMALRWFIFSLTLDPLWILPAQFLHGLTFIVLSVTMAMYINQQVPKELKASGQTLNALLSLGVAKIIGSFIGGYASEAVGMKQVFLYNGWIALGCVIGVLIVHAWDKKTAVAS